MTTLNYKARPILRRALNQILVGDARLSERQADRVPLQKGSQWKRCLRRKYTSPTYGTDETRGDACDCRTVVVRGGRTAGRGTAENGAGDARDEGPDSGVLRAAATRTHIGQSDP